MARRGMIFASSAVLIAAIALVAMLAPAQIAGERFSTDNISGAASRRSNKMHVFLLIIP